MPREVRFPSIGNTQTAYAVSRDFEWSNALHCGLDPYCKTYDTFGDGMTQHSPFYPVTENNAIDFLYSMAAHCLEHPEDAREMDRCWPREMPVQDFAKAARVKSPSSPANGEPAKPLYYKTDAAGVLETSSAKKCRYDNRWEPVPEWANGGLESTFRLLDRYVLGNSTSHSRLKRLCLYQQLSDWFLHEQNRVFPDNEKLHGIETGNPEELMRAFRVADNVIESQRLLKHIDKQIKQYREKNAAFPETAPRRRVAPGPGR